MRCWITGLLVAVAACSPCFLFLSCNAPGQPVVSDGAPLHAQRLARMISSHEMLKFRFSIWESDEAKCEVAMEMCDAFAQQADVEVSWTARHFGTDSPTFRQDLDEFEKRSMRRLRDESGDVRELWSDDRTRYMRAVEVTQANCVRCHEGLSPAKKLAGFTSITFSKPL